MTIVLVYSDANFSSYSFSGHFPLSLLNTQMCNAAIRIIPQGLILDRSTWLIVS